MSTICGWRHLGVDVRIHDYCEVLKPGIISIGDHVAIDAFSTLEGGQGIEIGDYVHLANSTHVNAGGGRVIIGSHSGTASHVVICGGVTDITRLHVTPMEDKALIHAHRLETVIGEYVVIFAGAIIGPGVHIGDRAIIGMGSVVRCDVPAGEVWAGNPARFIRMRKISR